MNRCLRVILAATLALAATGCMSLSPAKRAQAMDVATRSQAVAIDCDQPQTACARPSPLRALGLDAYARSAPDAPVHHVTLLEYGRDALLARLDLIRGAQSHIDVQTYIFDEDDAGHLVLDELLAAARRGVRVRLLVDQLSALRQVETLAALAGAHANFEMRIYNPVLGRARITYPQYVVAAACCWRELNRRMHNKILLVDGIVGITGGRNYQNSYFDWDDTYNFRDRDILVAGPSTRDMADNFEAFWHARRTTRLPDLHDVGRYLLRQGAPVMPHPPYAGADRVAAVSRDADDAALVQARLVADAIEVGAVAFIADPPDKHRSAWEDDAPATVHMREVIEGAREEVLLQTPYLVLSREAEAMFAALHARQDGPQVRVSTNSLAATDAFITYAMSYKYRRRHLRDFGFQIHEYKPFPEDAPVRIELPRAQAQAAQPAAIAAQRPPGSGSDARGAGPGAPVATPLEREHTALRYAGVGVNRPVPLRRAGVRVGLHSKSLVADGRIGVVGTHNFDPRGDNLNTESAVIIDHPVFAQALARSIRRDMAPENAWVIARRDRLPVLSGLEYSLAKLSERLPVFDLWPTRYATSYRFVPGPACPAPPPPGDPLFRACHVPVGDFPEVDLGLRSVLTRIFTAFGAGLVPIL